MWMVTDGHSYPLIYLKRRGNLYYKIEVKGTEDHRARSTVNTVTGTRWRVSRPFQWDAGLDATARTNLDRHLSIGNNREGVTVVRMDVAVTRWRLPLVQRRETDELPPPTDRKVGWTFTFRRKCSDISQTTCRWCDLNSSIVEPFYL